MNKKPRVPQWLVTAWCVSVGVFLPAGLASAQAYPDNETQYSNQDPNTETRRSDHFRLCFGHYNWDNGTYLTEQLVQGNLQMYEQMWYRWVVEMGLHNINESATTPAMGLRKANFNFLMSWNDGGGGGAYMSMDSNGFAYSMSNSGNCRYDPPSGATPHEMGHVWEGSTGGFNGSDSSGAWWECTANWMQLQFLNSYPQAGAYIANGMYYPAHGRDYYDSFMIWEAAREDARYGAAWVNDIWTNATPDQQAHEYIIDRMIRLDSSGSADKAGAVNDLWGNMAKKMVTWDYERKQWLAQANSADDGSDWNFYQRCRTPLVEMPGTSGWYRPSRGHIPMEFGFNFIPLAASPGTTVSCNFQPQCDPVRQSDWRACLVAVNTAGGTSYSDLWNTGTNTITLSADQTKLYLVVIATPKPMKIADPAWQAYLTDAGLQFPYAVAFTNAAPKNVIYPVQSHSGMVQHANGGGWKSTTATVAATAYLGPNAQVLNSAQVTGSARIEDYAVVKNSAQVRDNAVVSGHGLVEANAQVYGNAKVRDWGHVFGYAEIYENAKVIEHGNCGDGNSATHTKVYGNAIVKGTTYVYDTSTFNGGLIMDGDSANGNGTTASSKGVHFGWGWGQDIGRYNALPDNDFLFARHSFEKDNAVFAMDEFGIDHGFLMNGCRTAKDNVSPVRGGRVLPLDGTSQYVELHNSVNDFKDSTFALWFKYPGGATEQCLWSMGDGSNKTMVLTANAGGSGPLRFVITDGATTQTLDGPVIPTNSWKHVAVVFSGTTCSLYLDGVAVATNPAMTLFPDSLNAPLMENANFLGRGNAGNYFQGLLDDFRCYMRPLAAADVLALFNEAAPAPVTIAADTTAPAPNAATWLVVPTSNGDSTVTMSATRGTDASGWVEYYFTCVSGGGHDSGWVSFNKYIDVGLTPGSAPAYSVKMRDRNGNTTGDSGSATATLGTSSAGTASFSYGPIGIANGQITMTAATATNPSGKAEYKFDRTLPTTASSGWQASPTWTNTGLSTGTSYTYTVTVRDGRGNTSSPSAAVAALARDDAGPALPMPVAHWQMLPYATIDNKVSMTAQAATDPSGVQYYFHCVSGGGPDSAWQTSATFVTPAALADGTYVYQYKVRDTSARLTESPYSTSYPATITPTTGYHSANISQLATLPDDNLVSFPGTVMKVNADNYLVKDLATGTNITVKPNKGGGWTPPPAVGADPGATDAALALKNVTVKGHLYTLAGARIVTYATLTATGNPTLYNISGRVINASGTGIAGATVSFSDVAGASAHPIVTATTDASGNYTKGVTTGTWYVAVASSAYNTSADQVVAVATANVTGINFTLVTNANVTGTVTRASDGTPLVGASVYFSRSAGASASPVFTVTTDASGNYTKAVQDGVWYVAAGAAACYTSTDKTITVNGAAVSGINFALKSDTRSIPRTSDLLFSAVTDSLPASGATGNWATYLPSGQTLTAIGSPTVELANGVKWVKNNRMTSNDGFRQGGPYTSIPCNGVTIIAAVKPTYCTPGGEARGEIVDIMYDRLALAVSHTDGRIMVARNGDWGTFGPALANNIAVVLSLVVQPDGSYVVYKNGVQVMTGAANGDFSTQMVPTGTEGFKQYVNVGRNDPDGWSAFNGNIGDVFVYNVALTPAERQQLETDVTTKFLSTDYTITATAGSGGSINPTGAVSINPGGSQTFTISPLAGNMVNTVIVDGVPQGAIGSYTFSNVTASHTISATYSAIVLVPTTTLARHSGTGSSSTYGDSLGFDVTVSATPTATGTVTLKDGGSNGTTLGSGTLAGGACTITPAPDALTAGSHTNIVAVYAGDGNIPAMTSSALDTQTVSPKALTVTGAAVAPKIYDGTTAAAITGTPTLNGLVGSDSLTLGNAAVGAFADPNVATAKPVAITMTISGAAAANYTLAQPVLTGDITARVVALAGSRAYDGTTAVVAANLSISNNIDAASLSLTGSTNLAGKDAGSQALSIIAPTARVQSATGNTGANTATTIAVTMAAAPANGNTLVAVIATRGTTGGRVSGITQTGATWSRATESTNSGGSTTEIWYASNISGGGTDITITQALLRSAAVVIEYSGVLSASPLDQVSSSTGSSTAAATGTTLATTLANELWIGGIGIADGRRTLNSPYGNTFTVVASPKSGTTSSDAMIYALEKMVSATGTASTSGTINISDAWSGAIATFRTVTPGTLALSGPAAGNYTLTGATGAVTVTPKALTVSGLAVANGNYDGTPVAALTGTAALLAAEAPGSGTPGDGKPYSGDTLALGGTAVGAFADKHAGDDKPVSVAGVTLIGAQAGNYSLTQQAGLTANIAALPVTVAAVDCTKTYDGNTTAPGTPDITPPLAGGDTTTVLSQAFLTKDAGTANKVIVPAITINDGNGGANYQVTLQNFTTGTIHQATTTVTLGDLAQTYDGTPKSASATTDPSGLTVDLTYDGSTVAPSAAGSHAVVATVNETNYTGWAAGTLVISGDALTAWRAAHFTPEEIAAGLAADGVDADGDGFINLSEYTLGTDPRAFTPQPLAITPAAGNPITLSFVARSATGAGYAGLTRKYDIETTTDLANPNSWQAVAGHTNIVGADQTIDVTLPGDSPNKFYRLNVRLE